MVRKLVLGACLAAAVVVVPGAALAKGEPASKTPGQAASVCANPCMVQATDTGGLDNRFAPAAITVNTGTTITWTNTGTADHTVTAGSGATFDSGDMPAGATYQFTPTSPGNISYYCQYHQSLGMTGTITVQGSGTPGGPVTPPSPTASPSPSPVITTESLPTPAATPSNTPANKYFPKIGGALVVLLVLGIGVGYMKTKQKLADKS